MRWISRMLAIVSEAATSVAFMLSSTTRRLVKKGVSPLSQHGSVGPRHGQRPTGCTHAPVEGVGPHAAHLLHHLATLCQVWCQCDHLRGGLLQPPLSRHIPCVVVSEQRRVRVDARSAARPRRVHPWREAPPTHGALHQRQPLPSWSAHVTHVYG
jgi:hypothetical protein